MNKEFLKMQKLAGLITENQVKEIIGDLENTPSPDGPFNPNADAEADNADDQVTFLTQAFQHVWNMGKNNNTVNFVNLAKSTIEDLGTRF
jgi:hypothetical protein